MKNSASAITPSASFVQVCPRQLGQLPSPPLLQPLEKLPVELEIRRGVTVGERHPLRPPGVNPEHQVAVLRRWPDEELRGVGADGGGHQRHVSALPPP